MKRAILVMLSLVVLVFVQCVHAGGTAPAAAAYLPLIAGTTYSYEGTRKGRKLSSEIRIEAHTLSDKTGIFIFAEVLADGEEKPLIGNAAFGQGAYLYDAGAVYTIECFWRDKLKTIAAADKRLLLPAELKVGAAWTLAANKDDPKSTFEVEAIEDVKVPAGEFKACVKIHKHESWSSGTQYDGYVWLAKDVGVVKWIRTSGWTEELVKVAKK